MSVIKELIDERHPSTLEETKSALREVLQGLVLAGLSKGGFFSKASFYGGTALRIFYGLNRYSEDLDFTLKEKDHSFSFDPCLSCVEELASSYGIALELSTKKKTSHTPIESAFAKANTYLTFLSLKMNDELTNLLHKDEVIKVKFEVDCAPSLGFGSEVKWIDDPEFASISVLDEPSLFAGKLHAVLCRNYKNNVKGRDYYDFLFYMKKRVSPNLAYLRNKLIDTGKIKEDEEFDIDVLRKMLIERFETVNFAKAKDDAKKFLYSNENLDYFTKELFIDMARRL
jgi:predicted nucleotidyltransferase component of viral defense system